MKKAVKEVPRWAIHALCCIHECLFYDRGVKAGVPEKIPKADLKKKKKKDFKKKNIAKPDLVTEY